ncbi:MAG: hypothetical protein ACD_18C00218G0003 [uncultured bacterium]|nr:MAG: hypothetical protein ACD_18C00218G0003 [uncultured bacterium]OGH83377.1 MAG: hypothetical protein A2488_03260 [Candidatus Magasanikbacteria bacterium RIFOXYC12_FULL_32_21b]OGH89076.1 MAG: hypothetical protein A2507_05045 [Candidatus Magasanikbacteria bacterium RIFOXYD12_FULL_33_17]HAO52680.1 hypothetical protein [Candidatus Magasanikbacteria bacterium]
MKTVTKYFSSKKAKKIIELYKEFNTNLLPRIIKYSLTDPKPYIEFEWINGQPIKKNNLKEAFIELGKFHKSNFIKNSAVGFSTLCHGDFHEQNIIESDHGIKLIDVTYLQIGNNYSDLDYLDFFDWFPISTHPWMIKDENYFNSYLEGIELNASEKDIQIIKKIIAYKALNKFIKNGIKNNIDIELEKKLLSHNYKIVI